MIMTIANEEERSFVENIYYTYSKQMMQLCMSILKNKEDAQDAVSDAFVAIIKNVDKFWASEHLEGFVMVTTKNAACARYTKMTNKNQHESPFTYFEDEESGLLLDIEDTTVNLDQALVDSEFIEEVKKLLNDFPADVSTIVVYKFLYHYRNSEIAEMMGMDRAEVNMKLFRARKKLQKLLKDRYSNP